MSEEGDTGNERSCIVGSASSNLHDRSSPYKAEILPAWSGKALECVDARQLSREKGGTALNPKSESLTFYAAVHAPADTLVKNTQVQLHLGTEPSLIHDTPPRAEPVHHHLVPPNAWSGSITPASTGTGLLHIEPRGDGYFTERVQSQSSSAAIHAMQAVSKFIFGPSQEERVKKVQSQLRSEQRALDREMRQIDQGSTKTKAEIKKLAKKGDVKNAKVLAREVVRAQKQKNRLAVSKARLNSIHMQLQHQLAMYKVTGSMQKSTEIMKLSNQLVRLPQVSAVMRQMSAEMTKAGIMEEMMEDTLDSGILGEDEEEMEEEAQEEVEKVLYQLTDGKLGQASTTNHLPDLAIEDPKLNEEQEQQDMQRMQAALDGLLRG